MWMFEEEDSSTDRVPHGKGWHVEHPDDRDDELHREGGIPHWQGLVGDIVQNFDFE